MDIAVSKEGARSVIAVGGRIDTNTSPKLDRLARDLHEKGSVDIVVDLAECDYVSSAGLRVIVSMQKRAQVEGSLAFRNVSPDVKEVFEETGFDAILSFE